MKIGAKLGKPIKIDEATSLVLRDHFERLCIEVDLTETPSVKIPISAKNQEGGIWGNPSNLLPRKEEFRTTGKRYTRRTQLSTHSRFTALQTEEEEPVATEKESSVVELSAKEKLAVPGASAVKGWRENAKTYKSARSPNQAEASEAAQQQAHAGKEPYFIQQEP